MISDSSVPDHARAEAHRTLAIEDDSPTQRALKRLFQFEAYDVDLAKNGTSGLELFHKRRPSAIVLDLRLADISGRGVCQQITRVAPSLAVIVLSATADVADKIVLLEISARDYMTKPFSPRQLLARARTALRSAQADLPNVFCFDDVTVNFPKAEVMRGGQSVGFTSLSRTLPSSLYCSEKSVSRISAAAANRSKAASPLDRVIVYHVETAENAA
jgi:DNA-binding response OmpR family regulator